MVSSRYLPGYLETSEAIIAAAACYACRKPKNNENCVTGFALSQRLENAPGIYQIAHDKERPGDHHAVIQIAFPLPSSNLACPGRIARVRHGTSL